MHDFFFFFLRMRLIQQEVLNMQDFCKVTHINQLLPLFRDNSSC